MALKNEQTEFKNILLPIDLTGAGDRALDYAVTMAGRYGGRLHILHVVDTERSAAGFYVPHLSFDSMFDAMKEGAEQMVKEYCDKRLKGFKDFEGVVLEGAPAEEIIKYVASNAIDVVVMGTYGGGRVDRLFFGSTTGRVLKKAGCPVLVVPASAS